MNNLRIVNVEIKSSTSVVIEFSDKLYKNLSENNFTITCDVNSVPDSKVLSILVKNEFVFLEVQPLTPFVKYKLTAVNTPAKIISLENKYQLSEDGVSNTFSFLGPIQDDNVFKNILFSLLKDSVYNVHSQNTYESNILDALSKYLDKALDDINQVKNENYLFFDVIDEQKVRGSGPFDKLNEGSAFKISRVSRSPSNKKSELNLSINPSEQKLISLQQELTTEIFNGSKLSSFDPNSLVLNLSKSNVIRVSSISFTLNTSNPNYTYDIEKFGYQLKENKYDEFAFKYLLLDDNQLKLSNGLLLDSNFDISKIIKIEVSYYWKNLAILPSDTVNVFTIAKSNYELINPIVNKFNLKYSNIVDSDGNSIKSNGLIIKNTESNSTHQAFLYEIDYNLDALPFRAGQYCVDYSSGTCFVYGEDSRNNGTGEFPPLISYYHKNSYKDSIDYTYDSSNYDFAVMPMGSLTETNFIINFQYESVLIDGKDYVSFLHEESLNESVENNLVALNVLKTKNYPVTNVFDIYNQTTGEKYTVSRFEDDKVYFKYINAPNVKSITKEPINFSSISDELIVNDIVTNLNSLLIAKCELSKTNILSRTFDSLGNFTNTTFVPTDREIFKTEYNYLEVLSSTENSNKLNNLGDYLVDYRNGVVYCAIATSLDNLGFCNYYYSEIITTNKHILSVDDLYRLYNTKSKIEYTSFTDSSITFDMDKVSAEYGLNAQYPYYIKDKYIGTFGSSFSYGVKDNISSLNGVYEYLDFKNSKFPVNFSQTSNFSGTNIIVESVSKQYTLETKYSEDGYYVDLDNDVSYKSPNIQYSFTVQDEFAAQITVLSFDISNGNKLFIDVAMEGLLVNVVSEFSINDVSNIVVDYSSGPILVDYSYLVDEILVSYEYGENVIDFRLSETVKKDDIYYVSYKVGALRDALIRNFGTLINIPELATFDTQLERERYRDAIFAALSSFIKGSTSDSIKNIVYNIAHTQPNITESNLNAWELGYNILEPSLVKTKGNFEFVNSKHGSGILVDEDKEIKLSSFSNINPEEGTIQFWVKPTWNGLDDTSDVTFEIKYSTTQYPIDHIYIGSDQKYLTTDEYSTGKFTLNKSNVVSGIPSLTSDGIYVYYTDKWNLSIIDGYTNVDLSGLTVEITSSDPIFNAEFDGINSPTVTSGNNKLKLRFNESKINYNISFRSDSYKYFIDSSMDKSRFSIYKDPFGYLCFRVIDASGKVYSIKGDVSSWLKEDNHQIAVSWKIGSKNYQDELHLFLDGFEVSNNTRYSSGINPYTNQKYTSAERSFILSSSNTVGSNDLETVAGSSVVTSSINFSNYNITPGDVLYIYNDLFDANGYVVASVSGQTLTLASTIGYSISDLEFSINPTLTETNAAYKLYKNTIVTAYDYYLSSNDGYVLSGSNALYSSSDFSNVNKNDFVVIDKVGYLDYYIVSQVGDGYLTLDETFNSNDSSLDFYVYDSSSGKELKSPRTSLPDYLFSTSKDKNYISFRNGISDKSIIIIQTLGLNFERVNRKYYLWSDESQNIIKTQLPAPVSIDDVKIYKTILDRTNIDSSNSTTIVNSFTSNNLTTYDAINSGSGRTLNVSLSGSNIDFTTPVSVNVNGNVNYINTTETIIFNGYGNLQTTNKFQNVNYINVTGDVVSISKNYCAISCREYNILTDEELDYLAEIKYSYEVNRGISLFSDGYGLVSDANNVFSQSNIDDFINITSPMEVAGFYKIKSLSDSNTLSIEPLDTGFSLPLASFTDGVYSIIKSTDYRSGLQNGFFYFEPSKFPGQPYYLKKGFYEFDYNTYLNISHKFGKYLFIGSDVNSSNQCKSSINNFAIYNIALTDVRSGEIISDVLSVTKDFNSILGVKLNKNVLFFNNFDSTSITNQAPFYQSDKKYIYSNNSVNENFKSSVYLNNYSISEENNGYLSELEGTIDAWISPIFDSMNDNNYRFYFDSTSAKELDLVSSSNNLINLPELAESIISITTNNQAVNYAIGSRIELLKSDSTEETITSSSTNKVVLSNDAYQILSVKIVNNYSNIDYFDSGVISSDHRTIYLNKNLPANNTQVKVIYKKLSSVSNKSNGQSIILNKKLPTNTCNVKVKFIPKGMNGDRICLYKDKESYLNFAIRANSKDYVVRHPITWIRGSWHKVRVSWKTNSKSDNMVMFIDGYKASSITSGSNLILQENGFNQTIVGDGYNISLSDKIELSDKLNMFHIGSDYSKNNLAVCSMDNFKISNVFKKVYSYNGESMDPTYNGSSSYPTTKDLYTTYLLDSDISYERIDKTKFIQIINKQNGLNEFVVDVFDEFFILENSSRSKEIMELLINILKPANSRVFINYN